MKAQELKTKTSAQTLIYKIFLQRYQVYQGRLVASFQDDAKYEHVGQDTRSQDTTNSAGLGLLRASDRISESASSIDSSTSLPHSVPQEAPPQLTSLMDLLISSGP
ncbi:hypothetical protein Tco_0313223 [Tanacetum coccineum]